VHRWVGRQNRVPKFKPNEMEYVMQLYFAPGACSLASHITAREAGINLDLKLDNGQVLTEGVAIMQYLADQKPESNLVPRNGTFERYRVQEWLNYITSEVHKGF